MLFLHSNSGRATSAPPSLKWDWCAIWLLLAMGLGGFAATPLNGLTRITEETSEEDNANSGEQAEFWAGRSSAGRIAARQMGSTPRIRLKQPAASGRDSIIARTGSPTRDGHFLPGDINAPRRC